MSKKKAAGKADTPVEAPSEGKPEEAADATAKAEPGVTELQLAYAGVSKATATETEGHVTLLGDLHRAPVRCSGVVRDPLPFREALAALYAVVSADFRYQPKDRTAYLAYVRMKKETSNLNALQARQAYFHWLLRNDPLAFIVLDPVVTVHPDQILFEVFSKDEGAYALLGVSRSAVETEGEVRCGTTNVDFSKALIDGVQQMRSYRRTTLHIDQQAVGLAVDGKPEVLEKKIQAPDSWLRGFLQVQSSAALPADSISLAPIDLYNALRCLRMQADVKGKRRGLRIELVPGRRPILVLEPWETVIHTTGEVYQGKAAKVLRVWGRRRLMLLKRFLAFADSIDVRLLGSGLPSFWVFRGKSFEMTLGLTGFTAANWSQAVSFDLLLPRKTQDAEKTEAVVGHLSKCWFDSKAGISQATGLKDAALVEALQVGCQSGRLMYDLAHDVYRLRPLTDQPLDMQRLEFRNGREKTAHDLLSRKGAVTIESRNRIHGVGLELTGKVVSAEDQREYRPMLLLSDEGQVSKAECSCPLFRTQGLKHGPCSCLVALRLAYADEVKRQLSGQGGVLPTLETRTYSKRTSRGEHVVQLTLDRTRVRSRHGAAGQEPRSQTLAFQSIDDARREYAARTARLSSSGYLEALLE